MFDVECGSGPLYTGITAHVRNLSCDIECFNLKSWCVKNEKVRCPGTFLLRSHCGSRIFCQIDIDGNKGFGRRVACGAASAGRASRGHDLEKGFIFRLKGRISILKGRTFMAVAVVRPRAAR